ncbi:hypothetical protein SAMN04515647_4417 [Cohaesibacter sp. ES.047]|uniref:hypothetical protein n=1 Tax=Cohaesibacter sp. ES.047 TaxID=1798205 RepID=UPI000BB8E2BC|nr:hypothetical protein [Cohaesibacter sp. ES.047]SNY94094.1 hypothetical protein SAMN04515647_4417 [Cohaesibacter sp. ES.047]
MDKERIRQRHFRHGNSLKRIAADYHLAAADIAAICGYGPKPRPMLPDWFVCLEENIQALITWACDAEGVDVNGFHRSKEARPARGAVAWHLANRWGMTGGAIAAIIQATAPNALVMISSYGGARDCPIDPPLPELPSAYLTCLCALAHDEEETPLAIYHGERSHHKHLFRLFLGRLVHEEGFSQADVVEALGVDKKTVRRAAQAHLQRQKRVSGRHIVQEAHHAA